jgi:hypothetical protein
MNIYMYRSMCKYVRIDVSMYVYMYMSVVINIYINMHMNMNINMKPEGKKYFLMDKNINQKPQRYCYESNNLFAKSKPFSLN